MKTKIYHCRHFYAIYFSLLFCVALPHRFNYPQNSHRPIDNTISMWPLVGCSLIFITSFRQISSSRSVVPFFILDIMCNTSKLSLFFRRMSVDSLTIIYAFASSLVGFFFGFCLSIRFRSFSTVLETSNKICEKHKFIWWKTETVKNSSPSHNNNNKRGEKRLARKLNVLSLCWRIILLSELANDANYALHNIQLRRSFFYLIFLLFVVIIIFRMALFFSGWTFHFVVFFSANYAIYCSFQRHPNENSWRRKNRAL